MKILVAPLNWGLGHASRCVPLIRRLLDEGHEVVIGGDGVSFTLLRKQFPKLKYVHLAPLNLRYSPNGRQIWAIIKSIPQLTVWTFKDHLLLKAILREEHFDQVISDNRFGLYNKNVESIFITHQLHVMMPKGWRWSERLVSRFYACIYTRFNKVWVPDYDDFDRSLAGELSHPRKFIVTNKPIEIRYIGTLSRFALIRQQGPKTDSYDVVAVLSGLEPQRTILEQEIIARYRGKEARVLIVQGLIHSPNTRIKRGNVTVVPHMGDEELTQAFLGAKHIIARSGYSTIMDLEALGILNNQSSVINHNLELIPTPGQPEQEYLAAYISQKNAEKC